MLKAWHFNDCVLSSLELLGWFGEIMVKCCIVLLQVLCVDSGAVLDIGKECVRELPPHLLDTPAQAVACCLADVVPVEEQWCEAALTFFTGITILPKMKVSLPPPIASPTLEFGNGQGKGSY